MQGGAVVEEERVEVVEVERRNLSPYIFKLWAKQCAPCRTLSLAFFGRRGSLPDLGEE